jgi:hypothetical protein
MPVDNLVVIRVVKNIGRERDPCFHTQEGAGNLAVIAIGMDGLAGKDFEGNRSDPQRYVCLFLLHGTSHAGKYRVDARGKRGPCGRTYEAAPAP